MKKLSVALVVAFGLGIGVTAVMGARQNAIAVNASQSVSLEDGYYLDGSYIGWVHDNAKKMTLVSGTTYVYDGLFLDGHEDYHFKVFKAEGGIIEDSWWVNCSAVPTVNDYVFDYYGNDWVDNNASVKFNTGCRVVKITVDVASGIYTFDHSAPFLTIGNATERMTYDEGEKKYVYTINDRNIDDTIVIKTANNTVLSNYEDKVANNFYDNSGTKKLIAGGDITVYYNRWDTSTWISGYSDELYNFTTGFLGGTISGSECANPSEIIFEGDTTVWDHWSTEYAALEPWEKAAFQNAIDEASSRGGINSSLGNKLLEAAGRYIYLARRDSLSFSGVTISESKVALSPSEQKSPDTILFIAIISAVSLLGLGGYFLIRKKQED